MKKISKIEAKSKIDNFFKSSFNKEGVRKIKRVAMKHKIKLKEERKFFCKKCLNPLKGIIRISKNHKIIKCSTCGFLNRHKI